MNQHLHTPAFLADGGEMGQRIREFDWDNSPLGNPSTWPQSLKTAVRLMLSSGHPMFIWWGEGLIQFYNDRYRAYIGDERHPSALGQEGEICWNEIWPTIGPQIQQVMSGEGSVWREDCLVPVTKDGEVKYGYWTYSYDPIYDEQAPHQVGGVLVIVTETTHHVLEQKRQKEVEARWQDLFINAPSFMCIYTGPDHIYEYANTRYYELVGRTDVVGKSLEQVVPEVFEQGFGDLLDYIYASGESHIGTATPVTFRDENGVERDVFLDFVLQPIRNRDNQITGIFANGYDVTARILSQQSLEEQDRRKDEFLAMLAHELRNPLAPISNASELLTQTSVYGTTAHSLGELIQRQVIQLTRLIDDLLEVSRISQGRMELQISPVVLDKVIRFAVESTSMVMLEKRLRLTYDCADAQLQVNGDYARLVQSVVNILINATKYTEDGGNISIRLHRDENTAVIDVADSGIGIEANMLEKIFDLFIQVDKSIDRSRGGLGIGLSVVNTIVKMHGGTVGAQSKGLGLGATFSIRLPLAGTRQATTTEQANAALPAMKFLLVDDNEDAANSLSMLLQTVGHEARVVYRGADALLQVDAEKFDAVLLDIGLPDIDGYKVAQQIRATYPELVIVAVSGYGQAEDIRQALASGFSGHLTKPVSLDALESTVKHLLNKN
ncbi:MAG: ATP-binding protein [Cellvibrio sp.]|uniref:hybrid sensor histidine kinase/response regulator n=1 Tax=Cellvibrio sp. TaxID=1965322 RepID=UPI0031A854CD